MFDVGEYIVYGQNGICRIEDITHPDISGYDDNRLYYVLVPERSRESRLFCPTDNTKVVLRKIVTAEEAMDAIDEAESMEPLKVVNDRMRDECYKNVMKSCELKQWLQIIKTLLIRKKEREAAGKKITATDERYLNAAQDVLFTEVAIATGKNKDEVKELVLNAVSA
ncbi:MAG: CarD family transcriptional regulator [Lachnospiraceae bacterium]|nr:CarD family transcriptional regulator [Lachnospiraceae bacterium]